MSKHSKWAKVKHQKASVDVKRAANFTKLARVITVAAKEGGGDPNFNFRLRTAIDQALAGNMPKDNIDRAVKRGAGDGAGEQIEELVYEGFGPGGVGVLVVALTDNRNRTSASIKHVFAVHGGNMAGAGAVQWMFEKKGVTRLSRSGELPERSELAFIDAGADDIAVEDEETIITSPVEALGRIRDVAMSEGFPVSSSNIEWVFKEQPPELSEEIMNQVGELLETLDEDDDVQSVYSAVGSV